MATDTPDHGDSIQRMMAQGITIPDIASLYGISHEDVKAALKFVKPMRGAQIRTAVYGLWEAMGALRGEDSSGVSTDQIADYIAKMKPSQLPVALQSEFWSAQTKRLKYQEEVGDLWRTAAVQRVVADLLRIVRQSMTLMKDNVDQQTALTPRQAALVQGIADAVLGEMRDAVIEHFKGWDGVMDKEDLDPARREQSHLEDGA